MTAVHEHHWIKAKLFLNHTMDTGHYERSIEEQQLWAALALEHLAKWALSSLSPALIADPQSDGGLELLRATGAVAESDSRFVSAKADTVFKRCARVFRPFDDAEARKIASNRNDYLHGSTIGFTAIPAARWWQDYWAQAVILLAARDKEISHLVGDDRAGIVEVHLKNHKDYVARRWTALLEAARLNVSRLENDQFGARELAEWRAVPDLSVGLDYRETAVCPACSHAGIIEGTDALSSPEYNEGYDGDVTATAQIGTDYFSCQYCHLVLNDYDLLAQSGLSLEFEAEVDPADYYEPEYGND